MKLEHAVTTPLYQQLYSYVLEEIRGGRLNPGDRVPSEKELAEQFSVSRITSKRALEKLDQDGVIARVRGRGSFVAPAGKDQRVPEALTEAGESAHPLSARAIGLILPDFNDAYGAELIRTVEACCAEADYPLLLRRTLGRRDAEEQALRAFTHMGVAGLVVFPVHGEFYNAELLRLVLDSFPLVLVDRYLKGIPACAVYTDNVRAARELTGYLLDRGHQSIAFLSPPAEHTSTIEDRLQGFAEAFDRRGLRIAPELVLSRLVSTLPAVLPPASEIGDEATLHAFLSEHPHVTGIVASEYGLARLAARVLRAMGRSEGVEITCFDHAEAGVGESAFAYVRQDEAAMGRCAVKLLLAQIAGERPPAQHAIDFQLITPAVLA
jgi:GntR family transcriptional regulator, arabinose operon transcriptional repressor